MRQLKSRTNKKNKTMKRKTARKLRGGHVDILRSELNEPPDTGPATAPGPAPAPAPATATGPATAPATGPATDTAPAKKSGWFSWLYSSPTKGGYKHTLLSKTFKKRSKHRF
jgi:hypothetical protein